MQPPDDRLMRVPAPAAAGSTAGPAAVHRRDLLTALSLPAALALLPTGPARAGGRRTRVLTPPAGVEMMPDINTAPAIDVPGFVRSVDENGATLHVTPDGKTLVAVNSHSLFTFSLPDGLVTGHGPINVTHHNKRGVHAVLHPSGKYIAADQGVIGNAPPRGRVMGVQYLAVVRGAALPNPGPHDTGVREIAFSPDGKLAASASEEAIKLWDLTRRGALIAVLETPPADYRIGEATLVFSPDSKLLATRWLKGVTRLYTVAAGATAPKPKEVAQLGGTNSGRFPGGMIVFTPDSKHVVTTSPTIWSVPDGKLVKYLGTTAWSIAVSPDGKTLAADTARDGMIHLHSLPDGKPLRWLPTDEPQRELGSLTISPDGKFLAQAGAKGQLRIWSFPDGKPLAKATVPGMYVDSLTFTPDSKFLLACHRTCIVCYDMTGPVPVFRTSFYTPDVSPVAEKMMIYKVRDPATKETITRTVPATAKMPAGATCTCNLVGGTRRDLELRGPF
ncbi:MAG TPA: hypothetical protein VEA69_06210 [Tepidisphaeraceae bacterium]|nr:hypothetical protein [Tepidisphaeraceae bacterium]